MNPFGRFTAVWVGQLVSQLSSMISGVALGYWLWDQTGAVTALGLLSVLGFVPAIVGAPAVARVLGTVPLHRSLQLSTLSGLLGCAAAALVWETVGAGQLWTAYALVLWLGAVAAVQQPALMALVPALLQPGQFQRANGLVALVYGSVPLIAPALAVWLLGNAGLPLILALQAAAFGCAALSLGVLPALPSQASASPGRSAPLRPLAMLAAPGLQSLLLITAALAAVGGAGTVLLTPLMLARSGGDPAALGAVLTALGVGGVLGSLPTLLAHHPTRPQRLASGGLLVTGLAGLLPLALAPGQPGWVGGALGLGLGSALVTASTMTLWQVLTPPGERGPIFATRLAVSRAATVLTMLAVGPLTDRLLGPLFSGVPWPLLGQGTVAAMAVVLLLAALGCLVLAPRAARLPGTVPVPTRPATPPAPGARRGRRP